MSVSQPTVSEPRVRLTCEDLILFPKRGQAIIEDLTDCLSTFRTRFR